ncbi:MAG: HNH endonuclease [Alphaproteobacteria bacterium]|nr:HNH endonuclease [Alphaproteobacteria bacterium]
MSKEITLSKGFVCIVDDDDYEYLSQYRWHSMKGKVRVYASRSYKRSQIIMHRELMNPPIGFVVDHINGNTLDNRRSNLRICTHSQNNVNVKQKNKTGYKGVKLENGKWVARIQITIGTFASAEEAARAYDKASKSLHGEFAALNFPQ